MIDHLLVGLLVSVAVHGLYLLIMWRAHAHCAASLIDLAEWLTRNPSIPIHRSVVGRELLVNAVRAHRRYLWLCVRPSTRQDVRHVIEMLENLVQTPPDPNGPPAKSSRPGSSFVTAPSPAPFS